MAAHDLEQALNRAILAERAMERIQCTIRPELGQNRGQIAPDIHLGHAEATVTQGLGASGAGFQADRAFSRPAAHQNRNMLAHRSLLAAAFRPRLTVLLRG